MKYCSLNTIQFQSVSHDPQIVKKIMIENGEIPKIVGFAQVYIKPGQKVERHVHQDKYEVFLIEDGEGTIKINDKAYSIKKGDCFRLDPGDFHEIIPSGDIPIVITYFGVGK
jgi:mannose-6-phosphate isomerase-like protein (cupin superfamily)